MSPVYLHFVPVGSHQLGRVSHVGHAVVRVLGGTRSEGLGEEPGYMKGHDET